jgi:hypothetical protein
MPEGHAWTGGSMHEPPVRCGRSKRDICRFWEFFERGIVYNVRVSLARARVLLRASMPCFS